MISSKTILLNQNELKTETNSRNDFFHHGANLTHFSTVFFRLWNFPIFTESQWFEFPKSTYVCWAAWTKNPCAATLLCENYCMCGSNSVFILKHSSEPALAPTVSDGKNNANVWWWVHHSFQWILFIFYFFIFTSWISFYGPAKFIFQSIFFNSFTSFDSEFNLDEEKLHQCCQ